MASYLRPRRGKEATAKSQNIVLKRGEVFFETPSGGVGTGIGKIKMGDGSTSYASLPYFLKQLDLNDNNTKCAFTNATAATDKSNNTTYLNNIAPSNNLKTLFQNIKQLLLNYNSQLTSLNNDLDEVNQSLEMRDINAVYVPVDMNNLIKITLRTVHDHCIIFGELNHDPFCCLITANGCTNIVGNITCVRSDYTFILHVNKWTTATVIAPCNNDSYNFDIMVGSD